jgi:hypothetical protein
LVEPKLTQVKLAPDAGIAIDARPDDRAYNNRLKLGSPNAAILAAQAS